MEPGGKTALETDVCFIWVVVFGSFDDGFAVRAPGEGREDPVDGRVVAVAVVAHGVGAAEDRAPLFFSGRSFSFPLLRLFGDLRGKGF